MSDAFSRLLATRQNELEFSLEDVFQYQLLEGGHLDTIILELGLMPQEDILALKEQAYGIPAAQNSELSSVSPGLTNLLSAKLVQTLGIVPIRVEHKTLIAATVVAPDPSLLEDLEHMLSMTLEMRVITEYQFAVRIQKLYGLPLSRRMARLQLRLHEKRMQEKSAQHFSAVLHEQGSRPEHVGRAKPETDRSDGDGWAVHSAKVTSLHLESGEDQTGTAEPVHAVGEMLSDAIVRSPGPTVIPVRPDIQKRLNEEIEREKQEKWKKQNQRRKEQLRWTVDDALAEIQLANDRNSLVEVVVRFAHRLLHTVAIFVPIQKTGVRTFICWDIIHGEREMEEMEQIELLAEEAHSLQRACELGAPILGPLPPQDALRECLAYEPKHSVFIPVSIGSKVVCILYGDGGQHSIPPQILSELSLILPFFAKKLRHLFMKRKAELLGHNAVQASDEPSRDEHIKAPQTAVKASNDEAVSSHQLPPAAVEMEDEDSEESSSGAVSLQGQSIEELVARSEDESGYKENRESERAKTDEIALQLAAASENSSESGTSKPTGEPVSEERVTGAVQSPGVYASLDELRHTYESWKTYHDPEKDTQLLKGSLSSQDARRSLVEFCAQGGEAMPALAHYFPGQVARYPFGEIYTRTEVEKYSDVLFCLCRLGADLAAPILIGEIENSDRVHRYSAVLALLEIHVPAALPLVFQAIFDQEVRISYLAIQVVSKHRDTPGYDGILSSLKQFIGGDNQFYKTRAMLASSQLCDKTSVPFLIEQLKDKSKETREVCLAALIELTKADFGYSVRKWNAWRATHGEKNRMEWLLDGLSHKSKRVRKSAQLELNERTGRYHSYQYDGSKSQRNRAVARWQEWWLQEEEQARWDH